MLQLSVKAKLTDRKAKIRNCECVTTVRHTQLILHIRVFPSRIVPVWLLLLGYMSYKPQLSTYVIVKLGILLCV